MQETAETAGGCALLTSMTLWRRYSRDCRAERSKEEQCCRQALMSSWAPRCLLALKPKASPHQTFCHNLLSPPSHAPVLHSTRRQIASEVCQK